VRKRLKTEKLSSWLDSSVRKRIKRKDLRCRAGLAANGVEINIKLVHYIGITKSTEKWLDASARLVGCEEPIGKSLPDGSSGQK
jgi:hypothetical protein